MQSKKRLMTLVPVIVLSLLMITSAGIAAPTLAMSGNPFAEQNDATVTNTTFTTAWFGTFIDTLNPFTSFSQLTNWINMNTYLPLVNYDSSNHTIVPALATSWDVNYTNHTVIFHLNPNAVWSDGQPVTANDVVYTYNTAALNVTFIQEYVSAITSTTALNNTTVMVHFNGVLWLMFAAYVFIVPQHIWKNVDPGTYAGYNANATSNGKPYFVGDGPFVLEKYVLNQYAEIQANAKWFVPSQMPKLQHVIFEEFSSQSSAISSLQSGSIDGLARMLPANVGQFSNNSNFVVKVSPDLEYLYLSINVDPNGTGNRALLNLDVRQAMAHALNTTYIAQTVYHGYASTINSVLAPTNLYYDKNISAYNYSTSYAKHLLDLAGFNKTASNGTRYNSTGAYLSFEILVPSGDQLAVDMANLISSNLTAIGIKTTVTAEDTNTMAGTIWQSNANGTQSWLGQDMDLWDWFDNIQAAPQLLSVFLSNQVVTGTSDSGFANATFDNLWNETLSASTPAQAQNYSNQMQQMLHVQLPYIPLVVPSSINVWSSAYTNVSTSMPGGPFGGGDWMTFISIIPPTTTTTSNNYNTYYIIGGVIAAIVIIGAVVLVMRRRGREE